MCSLLCINKNFLAKSSFFQPFNTLFFLPLNASSEALLSLSFFLDSDSLSQCFYIFYSEFYSYCFHNFSSIFYFWVKKRLQLLLQPFFFKLLLYYFLHKAGMLLVFVYALASYSNRKIKLLV